MKKSILIIFGIIAAGLLGVSTPASVAATEGTATEGAAASTPTSANASTSTPTAALENRSESQSQPTFTTELDKTQQSSGLWAGKNFLLAGNELTSYTDVKNGLLFAAGNSLHLKGVSEYGFVAGNLVNFAGTTSRDLYIAGNIVTLAENAQVGRDVFVAGNELYVNTNLAGDLSVTAAKVILADGVTVGGNANLDAGEIIVGNDVAINGTLIYNDSATVSGIEKVTAGSISVYEVKEVSASTRLITSLTAKIVSIIGLFIAMILALWLCPKLRGRVEEITTSERIFSNAVCGLGALAVIPILAIFALFTIVGAPVGLVALLLYVAGAYLSQGITGLWLGHMILGRITKKPVHLYLELLAGVTLLGLLALVPFVGLATGFASLVFGFGTIIAWIKPSRKAKDVQLAPTKPASVKSAPTKKAKTALSKPAKPAPTKKARK